MLKNGINVLSLFDGMSCGRIALERAGIKVNKYYASEIDRFAMKIAVKNYTDTEQLGCVKDVDIDLLPEIDLLIGGSPCQGFSTIGTGLNFNDPRSKLFFEYTRILKSLLKRNPKLKFLLENVKMKKAWSDIITEYMSVEPIFINSALVSAQNRQRLYWTNIHGVTIPADRGIMLQDILEQEAPAKYLLSDKALGRVRRKHPNFRAKVAPEKTGALLTGNNAPNLKPDRGTTLIPVQEKSYAVLTKNNTAGLGRARSTTLIPVLSNHGELTENTDVTKSLCIDANYFKGPDNHGQRQLIAVHNTMRSSAKTKGRGGFGPLSRTDGKTYALMSSKNINAIEIPDAVRRLMPIECERLQTVPDNYTEGVSDTQRYKMLGNGWTIDVIAHIFQQYKGELILQELGVW